MNAPTFAGSLDVDEVYALDKHGALDRASLLTCRLGKRPGRRILLGVIDGTIFIDWMDSIMSPGVCCLEDNRAPRPELEPADGLIHSGARSDGLDG